MATASASTNPAYHPRLQRVIFGLSLASAVFCVAFPIWVIRPFRYQGPLEFPIALTVLHWAPWSTIVDALIVLWLVPSIWRAARGKRLAWLRRTGLVAAILVVIVCAVAARINIFEKMFHPISAVTFIAPSRAKIAADDMVMSVTIGGESHAYAIREMAYHHVVNDIVAGTPVIATY